ncbi:HdeD family acid-resistance protein [Nitratifractor sp.]
MLDYRLFNNNPELLEKFTKYTKIYGVIFIILGLVGIFYPGLMSLTTVIFLGWLLLFSGFFAGIHTWQFNRKDWFGWFKALIFVVTGALIIVHPLPGILALGILFAIYFFLDAFANGAYAFQMRPAPYWWVALLNGVLSLAIGIFFLMAIGNPVQTIWLVGILVGISLFFDGVMLLSMASAAKKDGEEKK